MQKELDANDEPIICPDCDGEYMEYREEGYYDSDKGYMIYNCKCSECGFTFETR